MIRPTLPCSTLHLCCTVPESAMDPSHSFTKLRAAASSFSSRRSVQEIHREEG